MKNLFLSACLGVASFAGVESHAVPRLPPGRARGNSCRIDQSVRVNRWFRNGEELRLRQLFDLDRNCNGLRLESISVDASSNDRFAKLTLQVNNRPADRSQNISGRGLRRYDFRLPPGADRLGSEINSLQLRVQGQVYVERLSVRIDDRGGRPGPGPGNGPGNGPGHGPRPYENSELTFE